MAGRTPALPGEASVKAGVVAQPVAGEGMLFTLLIYRKVGSLMTRAPLNLRIGFILVALTLPASADSPLPQSPAAKQPDAVTADSRHYAVEFENDIVRVLRVRLPAGESAPSHGHTAYCAIELTDSSLREGNGPTSESKAGQVFCGDATSHAPRNVGKGLAESIVVEFKNRQRAR